METYLLNVLEVGKLKIKVLEDSFQVSDSKMVPCCLFCMCKDKQGGKNPKLFLYIVEETEWQKAP